MALVLNRIRFRTRSWHYELFKLPLGWELSNILIGLL